MDKSNAKDDPAPATTVVDRTPINKSPEALRALAEAAERRRLKQELETAAQKEIGGRDGPDPVRYGDWEKGGIAWDF